MTWLLWYAIIGMIVALGGRAVSWADGHEFTTVSIELLIFVLTAITWPILIMGRILR